MPQYRDGVAAIVRKYGGTISRYIGDGMLILFGHPSAHEDDAERAVRAALEIAAADYAGSVAPELELRVRLGLATGLVIVGDLIGSEAAEAQAVVGETPNLAARLQALAEPDGVVIAEDTRRLIGGLFRLSGSRRGDAEGLRRAGARLAGAARGRRRRAASRRCTRRSSPRWSGARKNSRFWDGAGSGRRRAPVR